MGEAPAASNYLYYFILMIIAYPMGVVLCGCLFYEKRHQDIAATYYGLLGLVLAGYFLYKHMQTDVVYGKEAIEIYHAKQAQEAAWQQSKEERRLKRSQEETSTP
ncbi:hypothetical protein GCE9029_01519 [Grimontia celer]|uniref:Uncharacterized protein n=1 Tax=Grimontia celer TaxID=1796497 RepID=A0A128EZG9_9GAMM|nr:hypothetical protein [Grimontia celer]CZF79554.1 hypothetical protein GCE9029_01519 [Grimontia celer]